MAFEVVQLFHEDLVEVVHVWILRFHADPGNPVITEILVQVTRIVPAVLVEFGVIVGFFALIHLVQGVGLWLNKVWAEFLSIISTAVFLPLEIIEIVHEFHLVKLVTLVLNLAIVLYLIQRIRKRRHLIHEVHEVFFRSGLQCNRYSGAPTRATVVSFSIFLGVALIGVEKQEPLLDILDTLCDALTRVNSLIIRLTPLGMFAIAASPGGVSQRAVSQSTEDLFRIRRVLGGYDPAGVFVVGV